MKLRTIERWQPGHDPKNPGIVTHGRIAVLVLKVPSERRYVARGVLGDEVIQRTTMSAAIRAAVRSTARQNGLPSPL